MALRSDHGFLKRAAWYLPRVDAIGGSAAGVYVNNRVKVASLFRGVPRILQPPGQEPVPGTKQAWEYPFEVANEEVTAWPAPWPGL